MAKDKLITFKIEEEAKIKFEKLCKNNYTTISQALYTFVHQKIKQEEGEQILISDLKSIRKH